MGDTPRDAADSEQTSGTVSHARDRAKAREYFHWPHRMRTRTKWLPSGQDVLERWNREPGFLKAASERIRRISNHKMHADELTFHVIRANSALMTVTHFVRV